MKKTQIMVVSAQKGGVGKTTTVHNLGTNLARQGKKVLLIDLDSQSNLTMCMGYHQPEELHCTIADLIKSLIDETFAFQKEDYILHSEGCDLIPSSVQLSGIEPSLANAMSRESLLKKILLPIKDDYEIIIIDTAPSLGLLTINALVAATSVLIPVQAQYLSVKGLELLISTVLKVKRNINPELTFNGILITMLNDRLKFSKSILSDLQEAYGKHIPIYKNNYSSICESSRKYSRGEKPF